MEEALETPAPANQKKKRRWFLPVAVLSVIGMGGLFAFHAFSPPPPSPPKGIATPLGKPSLTIPTAPEPVVKTQPQANEAQSENVTKALRNMQRAFRTLVPVVTDHLRMKIAAGQPYAKQAEALLTLLSLTGHPATASQQQQLLADAANGLPSLMALKESIPDLFTGAIDAETPQNIPEQLQATMGKLVVIKRGADIRENESADEAPALAPALADALTPETLHTLPDKIAILPEAVQTSQAFIDWRTQAEKQAAMAALLQTLEEAYP